MPTQTPTDSPAAATTSATYHCDTCPQTTWGTLDMARVEGWRIWTGTTQGGQQKAVKLCPACSGTRPRVAPAQARSLRLPYRPPQDERHHYLFVLPCGCPEGLVEASALSADGPPRIADEGEAWEDMFETRAERRAARARGVRVVHVDHATYERDWFELMRTPCTHGADR